MEGNSKPTTLKSTMKAIQEALAIINPVAQICIHRMSRTKSFRNLYPAINFNSIYHTSTSSVASSTSSRRHQDNTPPVPGIHLADEDSGHTSTSFPAKNLDQVENHDVVLSNAINSRRFFFSARTTKSIMEEENFHLGHRKNIGSFGDPSGCEMSEFTAGDGSGNYDIACFCQESVQVTMNSEDPYTHFRVSMEEMVEAHGLRERHVLHQLLHCYLRLNDSSTHKFILLAFVDILANLDFSENRCNSPPLLLSSSPAPFPQEARRSN